MTVFGKVVLAIGFVVLLAALSFVMCERETLPIPAQFKIESK